MSTNGPFQPNVFNNSPVVYVDPPPEGQMVVPFTLNFSPGFPVASIAPGMNQLAMSQVCSVTVDNSQNPQPLFLLMGPAKIPIKVPALGGGIYPVVSAQGSYPVIASVVNNPTTSFSVNFILHNYRQVASEWGPSQNLAQNYPVYPAPSSHTTLVIGNGPPPVAPTISANPNRFSLNFFAATANTTSIIVGYGAGYVTKVIPPGGALEIVNPVFNGSIFLWNSGSAGEQATVYTTEFSSSQSSFAL